MLGFLKGKIISKNADTNQCTLLAAEVGYEINCSASLSEKLQIGTTVEFWLHTHVREDLLVLYGFETEAEKQFFRILIGVSGLGPKTALSLISYHSPSRLVEYILNKQTDEISEAPGVGKKLAQKIILELGSKLEKTQLAWMGVQSKIKRKPVEHTGERKLREDLVSALVHLGFQNSYIKVVVDRLLENAEDNKQGFEGYLKLALRELSAKPLGEVRG